MFHKGSPAICTALSCPGCPLFESPFHCKSCHHSRFGEHKKKQKKTCFRLSINRQPLFISCWSRKFAHQLAVDKMMNNFKFRLWIHFRSIGRRNKSFPNHNQLWMKIACYIQCFRSKANSFPAAENGWSWRASLRAAVAKAWLFERRREKNQIHIFCPFISAHILRSILKQNCLCVFS